MLTNSEVQKVLEISSKEKNLIFGPDFDFLYQVVIEMGLNCKVFDPETFQWHFSNKPRVPNLEELLVICSAIHSDVVFIKNVDLLPNPFILDLCHSADSHGRDKYKPIFILTSEDKEYLKRPNTSLLDRSLYISKSNSAKTDVVD